GLRQAIVTTSGRGSVSALAHRHGASLGQAFSFWVCGEDVERKKPDPHGYQLAIERLGLEPSAILAIEDSRNGLQAAVAAGLRCLVTLSDSSRWEGGPSGTDGFEAALAVLDSLGEQERPLGLLRGPACPTGRVTLSWLQQLSVVP
ncbi:MAG: HAD-IA family hydrolase, partial [Synechococcaceae cyanobacterium]|nr:HAD-IA family hydrolase [Synechococcaceae cyanobacterium]